MPDSLYDTLLTVNSPAGGLTAVLTCIAGPARAVKLTAFAGSLGLPDHGQGPGKPKSIGHVSGMILAPDGLGGEAFRLESSTGLPPTSIFTIREVDPSDLNADNQIDASDLGMLLGDAAAYSSEKLGALLSKWGQSPGTTLLAASAGTPACIGGGTYKINIHPGLTLYKSGSYPRTLIVVEAWINEGVSANMTLFAPVGAPQKT